MPLNPSIALGVRPIEIPNQLAQYAQVAQIEGAQRQGEVAQMQLDQLKQDRVEMQAFQKHLADNGGNPDLKQFAAMLLKSPKYYEKGVEMIQKLQEQDKFDAYLKRMQPAAAPAAPGMLGSGTAGIMPAGPAPAVNALAPTPGGMLAAAPVPVNALAAQPTLADLEARLREVSRFNIPQAKAEAEMIKDQIKIMRTPSIVGAGSTVFANGAPVYTAPEKAPAPPSMVSEYTFAKTPDGGNFRGSYQDFVTARAAAGRAPAQPAQPSAPVAVVDENGKVKYVTREQSFGMTPATAIEGLSPKDIQKREAVLPQARQSVKTINNTMSVIGETVDRILANPEGLDGITGVIYGRTPALTDAARKANADLEQLKNLAFVQGLTELRAASKTGAGVGNVSNREGDRFENLKASLDRTQSKTDLEDSLRRLKSQAGFTSQSMQEAFDETYKYKQTAPSTQTPTAAPNIDALLQKYK